MVININLDAILKSLKDGPLATFILILAVSAKLIPSTWAEKLGILSLIEKNQGLIFLAILVSSAYVFWQLWLFVRKTMALPKVSDYSEKQEYQTMATEKGGASATKDDVKSYSHYFEHLNAEDILLIVKFFSMKSTLDLNGRLTLLMSI